MMKKLLAVLLVVMMLVPAAFAEETTVAPRILVAYLSRSGENYNVGIPREGSASAAYAGYIEKGNTTLLAEAIAEATGGDLFAITTVTPYPDDYATMLQVAQDEIDTDARPELAGTVENMGDYDNLINTTAEIAEQKGHEKGRAEGRIEGRIEGKVETARNLIELGLEVEVISKATGLSIEEIQNL